MVVIFTPRVAPARSLYYNELAKKIDLIVISDVHSRSINNDFPIKFKYIIMKSFIVGSYMGISIELFYYLFKFRRSLIIIEQYSSPNAILAILILRFFRKQFILNADGGFVNYNESKIKKIFKSYLISSGRFVLSSGGNCDTYLKFYGVKQDVIRRSYLSSFSISKVIKNNVKVNFGQKSLMYVGQFINRKGIDLIIELARRISESINIFIIGGSVEDLKWINQVIPPNVKIVDFLDRNSLFDFIDMMDCILITTREDIWNYTLMESYARGKRVISSDAAGSAIDNIYIPEVFMFRSEDIDHLELLVIKSLSYEYTIEERNYYHKMASLFNIENMAASAFNVIQEMSNEK